MEFPKGNPVGIKTAAETASSSLGTERVSTPSVMLKVMYGKETTGTLVAAQMEMYGRNQGKQYAHTCTYHCPECS